MPLGVDVARSNCSRSDRSAGVSETRMTYRELADRSASLANALVSLGVTKGDRVALLLPQSFETVIAHEVKLPRLESAKRAERCESCHGGQAPSNTAGRAVSFNGRYAAATVKGHHGRQN